MREKCAHTRGNGAIAEEFLGLRNWPNKCLGEEGTGTSSTFCIEFYTNTKNTGNYFGIISNGPNQLATSQFAAILDYGLNLKLEFVILRGFRWTRIKSGVSLFDIGGWAGGKFHFGIFPSPPPKSARFWAFVAAAFFMLSTVAAAAAFLASSNAALVIFKLV